MRFFFRLTTPAGSARRSADEQRSPDEQASSSGSPRGVDARSPLALFDAIRRQRNGWQREVFNEYHSLVRGLILKAFGPHAEIEELVDDVFMSFFDAAQRVEKPESLRSYLVSITMNRIRTEIRARKRRAKLYKFAGAASELDRRASSDDPKAKAALIQLSNLLDELEEEERAVYLLRFVEGMPFAEVAQILDMSEATVQRRARRAEEHVLRRVSRNALLSDYVTDRAGQS